MKHCLYLIILSPLVFLTFGCNNNVKVVGTVKYSGDGSLVNSGEIVFSDGANSARGSIKDGRYSVGLLKDGQGIPKGTYQVTAESTRPSLGGQPTESFSMPKPLTVDVQKSMELDIVVDKLKPLELPSNTPPNRR
ncbi:MAG: hypothetical protein FWH27_03030 [Planctomycetaceae bacterium]|nr:hypothetical protein [Planctomycetaceae bacterium]